MSLSRRTALLAGAGGLGYRHRRRLRRRSDLDPIERALETEPPTVDPAPPVSLEHLEVLPAGVNELSNDEWNAAVELAWLYYREAAAFADAIPDTLAHVTE
ncbi:hypothetical protein [Natronococcus sp.]|uniref:hypothetical protein n=1 Tax=Natronococcus sp. TaxID=35747 RepID=UPI0025F0A71B|nr:hypothetical protein [Natronococcus sp.]